MGLFLLVMAGLFSRSEDTLSTDGEGIAGRARKEKFARLNLTQKLRCGHQDVIIVMFGYVCTSNVIQK